MEISTIPDIINNQEIKLADVLNHIISEKSNVYIATAYFNLAGFELIKDKLKIAKEANFLIGKEVSSEQILTKQLIEQILQEEIEEKIDEKKIINLVNQFLDFINQDKVKIRIYKDGFFHGKFYVIEGGIPTIGGVVIIGSSNFTYAGLTSNTEYNAVIKQDASVQAHKQEFLKLFNDVQKTEDYKPSLVDLFTNFIKEYPPYDIYMKILYSYFEDKLSESPPEELPSSIILADFQRHGYIFALQALRKV